MSDDYTPKLDKVGEFGYGKTTICLISTLGLSATVDFPRIDSKHHKLFTYILDFKDKITVLEGKLINTVNYLSFAGTIVCDYPAFIVLMHLSTSLISFQKGLDQIILFNPKIHKNKFLSGMVRYRLINLINQNIYVNIRDIEAYILQYPPDIKVRKSDVIGLESRDSAVKFATLLENSKVHFAFDYNDALDILEQVLNGNA